MCGEVREEGEEGGGTSSSAISYSVSCGGS